MIIDVFYMYGVQAPFNEREAIPLTMPGHASG